MYLPSDDWGWLLCLAAGVFPLLIGYRVVPVQDETWYRKNGKVMKVCGWGMLLWGVYLTLERFVLGRPHP